MDINELWKAALGELELSISKPSFTTWFKQTKLLDIDTEGLATIAVPSTFTQRWLSQKYNIFILRALQNVSGKKIKEVLYKVVSFSAPAQSKEATAQKQEATAMNMPTVDQQNQALVDSRGLNPRYTFENFVVGKGNEIAFAASQAVVANPGVTYNPLFIYGGSGLGKTHLLQAIGHYLTKKVPNLKMVFVTCETFVNDYIHSVKNGKGKEFKDRYRGVDLFLIDDIQFLINKDGSQEEFFHTFNELHVHNKQIIITSDRPSKAIPTLPERLVSRFQSGMMVDISSPDFETRTAILEAKCHEVGFNFLDKESTQFIASIIQSNVRELEGALNRVIGYCQFKNVKPTLAIVKTVLSSFTTTSTQSQSISPRHMLETVASFYNLKLDDLLGKNKEQRVALPRQIAMFLLRKDTNHSFPFIGQEVGGRDHTTVMHAFNKISKQLEINHRLREEVELIKKRVYLVEKI